MLLNAQATRSVGEGNLSTTEMQLSLATYHFGSLERARQPVNDMSR